jgi:hypothetical protein
MNLYSLRRRCLLIHRPTHLETRPDDLGFWVPRVPAGYRSSRAPPSKLRTAQPVYSRVIQETFARHLDEQDLLTWTGSPRSCSIRRGRSRYIVLAIGGGHSGSRLAVAIAPSQRALGLTVRSKVVRSTAMRPNVGRNPKTHSKLSRALQWM